MAYDYADRMADATMVGAVATKGALGRINRFLAKMGLVGRLARKGLEHGAGLEEKTILGKETVVLTSEESLKDAIQKSVNENLPESKLFRGRVAASKASGGMRIRGIRGAGRGAGYLGLLLTIAAATPTIYTGCSSGSCARGAADAAITAAGSPLTVTEIMEAAQTPEGAEELIQIFYGEYVFERTGGGLW
jgi:hypothetical protein